MLSGAQVHGKGNFLIRMEVPAKSVELSVFHMSNPDAFPG